MFSTFSKKDWFRLIAGLAAALLLCAFSDPLASWLKTPRSFPLLIAFLFVFVVISNVAAFVVEHHLALRNQVTLARYLMLGCLALGVLYVPIRHQIANWLTLSPSGVDGAIIVMGAIVVQRALMFPAMIELRTKSGSHD